MTIYFTSRNLSTNLEMSEPRISNDLEIQDMRMPMRDGIIEILCITRR